ncbi:metallophosphoesterase family protein [Curtobacterium sp. MCBD17_035]|uniref:metallophosphoesterase family protein n=1 Tax=Curtobacterium sp. MCBD17_035 TaxID=2175673 RepID=UPI0011B3C005|nr:metallophosphoesterase [Curtobacterium sp. MCBD17_035]WIB68917.1 metallophosphoesterase family protein [Curtobacterium sp. MCBD17_035]
MVSSVAVLSDVHGMLPALERVLSEPAVERAELIVVTGDHTWGPQPAQVLDRLMQLGDRAVLIRGNADRELLSMSRGIDVGLGDDPVSVWGAAQLASEHRALLESMAENVTVDIDGFRPVFFSHATPRNDEEVVLARRGVRRCEDRAVPARTLAALDDATFDVTAARVSDGQLFLHGWVDEHDTSLGTVRLPVLLTVSKTTDVVMDSTGGTGELVPESIDVIATAVTLRGVIPCVVVVTTSTRSEVPLDVGTSPIALRRWCRWWPWDGAPALLNYRAVSRRLGGTACPACTHRWDEHPGGEDVTRTTCGECEYELGTVSCRRMDRSARRRCRVGFSSSAERTPGAGTP